MTLDATRNVVATLRRLNVPVPQAVAEALTTTDALLAARGHLVAAVTPAGEGLPPQPVYRAQVTARNALHSAAQKGPVTPEQVAKAAAPVMAAQSDVDRDLASIEVIDTLTGGAHIPTARGTEAEGALLASADELLTEMHQRVRQLVANCEKAGNLLGDLPRSPSFALVAKPEAIEAYRQVEKDAETYADIRTAQRALLTLSEGLESIGPLWRYAEVATGLGFEQQAQPTLVGWMTDQPVPGSARAELAPAVGREERINRLWHHTMRYGPHVWVPTVPQLHAQLETAMRNRTGGVYGRAAAGTA